jgi:hypothetical protein
MSALGNAYLDFERLGPLQCSLGVTAIGPAITEKAEIAAARRIEVKIAITPTLNDPLGDQAPDLFARQQQVPREFAEARKLWCLMLLFACHGDRDSRAIYLNMVVAHQSWKAKYPQLSGAARSRFKKSARRSLNQSVRACKRNHEH